MILLLLFVCFHRFFLFRYYLVERQIRRNDVRKPESRSSYLGAGPWRRGKPFVLLSDYVNMHH